MSKKSAFISYLAISWLNEDKKKNKNVCFPELMMFGVAHEGLVKDNVYERFNYPGNWSSVGWHYRMWAKETGGLSSVGETSLECHNKSRQHLARMTAEEGCRQPPSSSEACTKHEL